MLTPKREKQINESLKKGEITKRDLKDALAEIKRLRKELDACNNILKITQEALSKIRGEG